MRTGEAPAASAPSRWVLWWGMKLDSCFKVLDRSGAGALC